MLIWDLNTGELVLSEAGPERVPWVDTATCPWGCLLPGVQQGGPWLGCHVNSCAACPTPTQARVRRALWDTGMSPTLREGGLGASRRQGQGKTSYFRRPAVPCLPGLQGQA